MRRATWILVAAAWCSGAVAAPTVERLPASFDDQALTGLDMAIVGRVDAAKAGLFARQWPGTYFETAFEGSSTIFEVGEGDAHLKLRVDDEAPLSLFKPEPGFYRLSGLSAGPHRARIDVVSENQAGSSMLGSFYADAGTKALPVARRERQIEFIGDSYTVGYGNTSATRDCKSADVWATTDASQGFGPRVAAVYGADYQINAISGRGIVRNYNGADGETLPVAYPYPLLREAHRSDVSDVPRKPYDDVAWQPEVIVISLGTNDFSTPLKPGEKWPTRAALHADYEATYAAFVQSLRRRHPQALFVLWATDDAKGEIAAETLKVVDGLKAAGDRRIAFVLVEDLEMTGCNYHPSLKDDAVIAESIVAAIDAHRDMHPEDAPAKD